MARTIDLSGNWLSLLLYACQFCGGLGVLFVVALPLDGFASVALAGLFAVIVTATAVGLWRRTTDSDGGTRLGTAEDITYDPFADPGQAVRRPPGDDEHDD